jgi:hypothetical protein
MKKECDTNCKFPGWLATIGVGLTMFVVVMVMFFNEARADVRVDIERKLPYKTQHIVQQFHDFDSFAMWMETKLENGCDPYVEKVVIDLKYKEFDNQKLGEYDFPVKIK